MVKEQKKKSLYNSLVGILKSNAEGLEEVETWLETCRGKLPQNIQMLDEQVVWLQFSSPREVEEVLSGGCLFPFSIMERWMEVLGSPPNPTWVMIKGLLLQVLHVGVFRLLGECLGRIMEVDERTLKKEALKKGILKVLLYNSVTLPLSMPF